ncbi:MAG: trypsin-like peptidase domain-containing protein [Bacteroidia bacterium]|nr:trypsin-like peptidase domain-containing protein [Bacteroidia bacterium]
MNKYISVLKSAFSGIVFVLFICHNAISQNLSPDEIKKIKEATVFVEVKHSFPFIKEELSSSGSGFFIGKAGYAVTNYHVIQPVITAYELSFPSIISSIKVISESGTEQHISYDAAIIAVDKKNDLVLLAIKDTVQMPFLETDFSEKLTESSAIWVFGYPLGEEFSVIQRGPEISVSKGFITALRHDDIGSLTKIQLDAVVKPGNSGGPLINEKGKVIGVVNLAYGKTGFNFAVPAHYLEDILKNCNKDSHPAVNTQVEISSDPQGATVFIDSKPEGVTPLNLQNIPCGYHSICIMKNGYEKWIEERTLLKKQKIDAVLNPLKAIPVLYNYKMAEDIPAPVKYDTGRLLYFENFDNVERFKKWKQNTGGDDKRTWFLEKGILNQFNSDNMLHAISVSDSSFSDFVVKAKVKISDEHNDSRAGLIFNETENGFYLFRIHKESRKAQLAYHCKHPFGWFIISEKPLGADIKEDWFRLCAVNSGGIISCYFNDNCFFTVGAKYSGRGKIGFYSVESKASFDSLSISSVKISQPEKIKFDKNEMLSFWFTDYLNAESTWWTQYANDPGAPALWYSTDGGTAQFDEDNKTRYNEFSKYKLKDFELNLLTTLDKGSEDASVDIFFRKSADARLTIHFDKKEKSIELIKIEDGKTKVLEKRKLPETFFNNALLIHLVVDGNTITLESSKEKLLEYKSRNIPLTEGAFGFATTNIRMVLHQLTVTSVKKLN